MSTLQRLMLYLTCCFLVTACASLDRFSDRQLDKMIEEEAPFKTAFTGFTLYDPDADEIIYSQYGDRYFTPASNIKILTLYTALHAMGDSIPFLEYQIDRERFTLVGTACPAFLHPDLPQDTLFMNFLKEREGPIEVFFPKMYDDKYGPGWAWDDHVRRFQHQRSSFPIYGNAVSFEMDTAVRRLKTHPEQFQITTQKVDGPHSSSFLRKRQKGNVYEYGIGPDANSEIFHQRLPFQYSEQLFTQLLANYLGREVRITHHPPKSKKTVYYPYPDSLYSYCMHQSDNFIAEQLLLQSANILSDSLAAERAIHKMLQSEFHDLPQQPQWVDGSGISRYNMLTPDILVHVLDKMYDQYEKEQWKKWFAAGGEGTLENRYTDDPPWLYAKTGTNRNNHCLSGFLITRNDKVLLFSFMNNHYTGSSASFKKAMERVLLYIRDTHH